jgi:hypothetical protein
MAGRLGVPAKTVKIWHHAGLSCPELSGQSIH